MATRSDVQAKLNVLKEDFARLVQSIDRANAEAAAEQARALQSQIRAYLDFLQTSFPQDVTANRLIGYDDDRIFLSSLSGKPADARAIDRLNRVTVNLSAHLRSLEKVTAEVYPKPPFPWKEVAARHWKIAAGFIVLAAVAAGISSFISGYNEKRTGVIGQYFADMELKALSKVRKDPNINFMWRDQGPFKGWRRYEFSARWSGYIRIPKTDKWEFFTHSDDGARLRVADALVIDDWNRHGRKIYRAELLLEAGYYPFSLEYFEHHKNAEIRLFWKASDQEKPSIVPPDAFTPSKEYLKSRVPLYEVLNSSAVIYATVIPQKSLKPAKEVKQSKPAPAKKR